MEESQRVAEAIYFGLGSVIIIGLWWWLADTPPGATESRWQWLKQHFISSYFVGDDQADDDQADENNDVSGVSRNSETPENSAVMPKDERSEMFQFPDTFQALARLCNADKLKETDALKIGIKVSAGATPKYKEARRRLTMALNELQPDKYAPLTQEQIDNRRSLDLPIKH